ncbi:MAG TPA: hypothetical protein VHW92_09055 [Mycobacteriales bacterium]|nr:hypothetical protein [Mycobacteriales bacterium]
MPDDDDRPSDASSAADPSWAEVTVPDTIAELVADIEAYHREVRRNRRRARRQRLMSRPGVLPLSIVSVALVLTGIVATLLTVLAPSRSNTTVKPLPLATGTTAPPGDRGGILPRVTLAAAEGQAVLSTALRPSVVALVPVACDTVIDCNTVLNQLAGQADEVGYPLDVVVPSMPEAGPIKTAVTTGKPRVLVDTHTPADPDESLYALSNAKGLTVLLVRRNGVIADRFTNVTGALPSINGELVDMSQPQASR